LSAAHITVAITLAVPSWQIRREFVGSEDGLGYLILVSTSQSRTPLAFAALALLSVISIVLCYGIAFIERIAVPWARRS
jgi:NitT/TauT family transport system permease protein